MSEQTARLVERLRQRLHATIQRITLAEAAYGLVLTLGLAATVWLLLTALEAGLWLDPTPRSVLVGGVAVIALGVVGYYLLRPLLQLVGLLSPPSEEAVARRIGQHYPEVSDRLVNVLQLAEGRRSHAPAPLVDRAVRALGEDVQSIAFEQIEDFSRARRASRLASLPLIGLLAFLVAAPSTFLDASERLLSPLTPFERPAPFQLEVAPGDTDLVRGDSLQITVRATGRQLPHTLTLSTRHEDEEAVDTVELDADSAGVFRHTLVNVRQSLRYRVDAHPVESRWYAASVTARPLVRSLQVTLTPPAYTNLPRRRLDPNVGDIAGLPGTRVTLDVGLGGPTVDEALVAFDDGAPDTLAVEDGTASGQFTLQREGTYRLLLRSTDGVPNRDPIEYDMELRADAAPSIVFLAPDAEADLPESMEQPLRLRLSDDFGFARLRLYYRVSERRFGQPDSAFDAFDLPLDDPRQLDQHVDYRWQLREDSGLDLAPGDVVEYYARVWDNDAVAGYKSTRTETQRLRLPSLAEKYEALDEQQDGTEQQMRDMMQESESIHEQFDELRNELRRKQDADWEDRRQLEQLKQRQEQLESSAEELSRQMEDVTRRMEESDLADSETVQLYQELQQVVEEINSPELMEALEELEQSLQDLDLQQMQQALENFEFNEQQYQERLERSLELFKQLRVQQKLDEAARRADDLRQQEERLAEETQRRRQAQDEDASDAEDPAQQGEETEEAGEAGETEEAEEQTSEAEEAAEEADENATDEGTDNREDAASQEDERSRSSDEAANEDLAQQQERASEEMQALEEQLEKLREQMEEVRSAPKQDMDEMMQELREQNLPEQMQQNSQQLRQNELDEAQQGQQQMQQQLQQMQQQLQNMQQGMQGQQQQMNIAALRKALDNTLLLSKDQENLRHTVRDLSADSPTLRNLAQDQVTLSEGLRTVSDSLQQLARDVPQMTRAVQRETGDALRAMAQATDALSERDARTSSGHQKESMMHLNELALLLSDLLDQLMQGGQGAGGGMSMQQMLEQLQKMSGDQQQLNEQIQQFLNDAQGERLSTDQQERLEQLARQQEAIKQQLEELGREGDSDLRDQLLGDLDQVARQMDETIRELQQNEQNRRTLERQQQILTRLLQAQQSMQERGKEQQREGQEPEQTFDRESPEEMTREEQIDRLRRDLIRALDSGYAPDYEELIKRYFELLQEQE